MDSTVSPSIIDDRSLNPNVQPDALASLPGTSALHENNPTPPIHSLPAEIFLDILFISIDFITVDKPLIPQLHNLAQVCAYWLHSIRSNPRFWTLINFKEQEWIDTVLKKNPTGPLAVRCISTASTTDRAVEFLRFARQHAHRWETVTFTGKLEPKGVALFEVHAPLLKYLDLRSTHYTGTFDVHISAPALQHALFHHLHLPFDSKSLSGLKYLMLCITSSAFPSLLQLLAVLRASPALEWFGLEELRDAHRDTDTTSSRLGGPVLLPALRGLLLQLINHDTISAWIDAPNCRLFSGYIPFDVLIRPGSTAVNIAKIPIQTNHTITVYLLTDPELVIRSSEQHESELRGTRRRAVFQSIGISDIPDGVEPWRVMMETLDIPAEGRTESFEIIMKHSPSTFSEDQIGVWHSASSIYFGSKYPHVLRALKFLAGPTVVEGEVSWNCPRLKSVRFAFGSPGTSSDWYPGVSLDALVDGILGFLWGRSVSSNGAGSGDGDGEWPISVKVINVSPELFERLQGKVPEGTEIQDCDW